MEWKETRLSEIQRKELENVLNAYNELFSDKPGSTSVVFHEIKTKDNKPAVSKPYRYEKPKQAIIDYHVQKMLRDGIIMPVQSAYAAPIVLCRKNNGKSKDDPEAWRFAVDYRKLNAITECPQYPLPHIDDLIASLPTIKFMTSLDLTAGYHQVPMHPDSIEKTAFITNKAIYAFKKMPFGLSGAPATFQRLMDTILRDLIGSNVFVYLDDILIVSETFEEHMAHLKQVFNRIQKAGMTIKLDKCAFAREELKYLGYNITPQGIKADSSKFEAIRDMPPPKIAKQLASFLGLVGWYQKFIPAYATICEPLYALKRKRVRYVWSSEAQEAFDKLKTILTSERIILTTPNYNKQLEVWTDASAVGIGAVLAQEGRPIAYASRSLKQAERNYGICDREALAVIYALEKFRPYFSGLPIKVITDHSALTKLTTGRNLSPRLIRWALRLAEFNIEIEHREGKQNAVADGLSRIPLESQMEEKEDKIQCCMITSTVLENVENFKEEQKNDPDLGLVYQFLRDPDTVPEGNHALCVQRSQDFRLIDGLLFYKRKLNSQSELRVYIPQSLRKEILREHHDNPLAGHLGVKKTLGRLKEVCYFPQMKKIVNNYVTSCDTCQKYNYRNILPAGKLIPIKVKKPLEMVGIDLIGPYPASNPDRYRYVLVITDYFSKWSEFIPLKKASAQAVTKAFIENFVTRYGAPIQAVSDNGVQFVSLIFEEMCQQLGIKHLRTVNYRPQSNQAERVNRNLVQMIAAYVKNSHTNWDKYLAHFAYALRTAVHESTGKTPAELFLGRKILTPFQRLIWTREERDRGVDKTLEQMIAEARHVMGKAQRRQEAYYNMRRREMNIQIGDYILLENHQLSSKANKVVGKFFPKYIGPYRVIKVRNNNLIIEKEGRTIPVNMDQVRIYKFRADSVSPSSEFSTAVPSSRPTTESTRTAEESDLETSGPSDERSPEPHPCPQTDTVADETAPHHTTKPVERRTSRRPPKPESNVRPGAQRRPQQQRRRTPAVKEKQKPAHPPPTISDERAPRRKKQQSTFRRVEERPPPTISSRRKQKNKKFVPPAKTYSILVIKERQQI